MIEEWRPVVGYEGLYEVSNLGRVRSLDMYVKCGYGSYRLRKGKVLSPEKNKDGYLLVSLFCNGKRHLRTVHRLVAEAFIENPDNLPQVNHKDENKSNNRVDNLEWCDQAYNNLYGTRLERLINTKIKKGYVNEENVGLSQEEWRKKYYEKNREKNREKIREYYEENKDKRREYAQKYYQKNKENILMQQKEYYQENKDRICEQKKENYRKKKEQIQNNA